MHQAGTRAISQWEVGVGEGGGSYERNRSRAEDGLECAEPMRSDRVLTQTMLGQERRSVGETQCRSGRGSIRCRERAELTRPTSLGDRMGNPGREIDEESDGVGEAG